MQSRQEWSLSRQLRWERLPCFMLKAGLTHQWVRP